MGLILVLLEFFLNNLKGVAWVIENDFIGFYILIDFVFLYFGCELLK